MNKKVAWVLGISLLLGSIFAGNYYLGWNIPYLPTQSTLPLLMEEPVEIYKNYQIIVHVGTETYYYARSLADSSIVSPHFLVPGDAMASIALVKGWIDANPGPTPPPPLPDFTNTLILASIVIGFVAGFSFILYALLPRRVVAEKRIRRRKRCRVIAEKRVT